MAGSDIRLNSVRFQQVANTAGHKTNAKRAEVVGVDEATMSRVFTGVTPPSRRVIAGILRAYPAWNFEDLFELVPAIGIEAEEDDESLLAA